MDNELLYHPGDVVICKVNHFGKIVASCEKEFDQTYHFDIICNYDGGYLILVPSDLYLKSSFTISKKDCKEFKLPSKFIGGNAHFIYNKNIVSLITKMLGTSCNNCFEYHEYAQTNDVDENNEPILICYACRINPYR